MENNLGNKEAMAKNIARYMDETHTTRKELCAAIHVPYTTLRDWLKAITYPRIDKIELMSNYFGISKADLVEEYKPNQHISEVAKQVAIAYDKADVGTQTSVRKLLDIPDLEPPQTPLPPEAEAELAAYRRELEAEQKGKTSYPTAEENGA